MLLSGSACKQVVIKTPCAVLPTAGVGSVRLTAESPPPAAFLHPAVQSLPHGSSRMLALVLKAFTSHTMNKEHAICFGDVMDTLRSGEGKGQCHELYKEHMPSTDEEQYLCNQLMIPYLRKDSCMCQV